MAKITILFSLAILCLLLLSSTSGEDPWKQQIRKRLARASIIDWYSWYYNYWWKTTTRGPRSTRTRTTTTAVIITTITTGITSATTATTGFSSTTTDTVVTTTTTGVPSTTTATVVTSTTTRATSATTARVTTPLSTTARTTASTTTSGSSSSFTTFQNEALAQTNKYRADHCAPNLILNVTLNSIAQAYAVKLVGIGSLVHSDNGYGENLYYGGFGQSININSIKGSTAVDSWYSEVSDYDWDSPGFSSETGHFTQLVWINTKQMGIGIACTSDQRRCYIVANYSPPGNYGNQYRANVKQNAAC